MDSEIAGFTNGEVITDDFSGSCAENVLSTYSIGGALGLFDVPRCTIIGTRIEGNTVGIDVYGNYLYCNGEPGSNVDEHNETNLFIRNQSRIANNQVGIYFAKGGELPPGEEPEPGPGPDQNLDYGLVSMQCSELVDNQFGIRSVDVLLEIDGYAYVGYDPEAEPRSNRFSIDEDGGRLFDICYADRADDIAPLIPATGNDWSGLNMSNPDNSVYRFRWCNGNTPEPILLNAAGAVTYDGTCPPIKSEEDATMAEAGTGSNPEACMNCLVQIGGEDRLIHNQYTEAMRQLALENYEAVHDLMLPIAALEDAHLENGSSNDPNMATIGTTVSQSETTKRCRQYRSLARVFANPETAAGGLRLPAGGTVVEALDHLWTDAARGEQSARPDAPIRLLVQPNPTDAGFTLSGTADGIARFRCFDSFGRQVRTGLLDGPTTVPTRDWALGVYLIEVRYAEHPPVTERVVVQR